ncbi:uncharacterized protein VTP21DRAFT_8765 [Calcarisporiella thermophila]|uniref:uncharacterized protein n=1 Tax=Calcarisporiella thermophila TaxID=911321 RepID=UPI0037441E22
MQRPSQCLLAVILLIVTISAVLAVDVTKEGHSNYGHGEQAKEHVKEHLPPGMAEKLNEMDENDVLYYLFTLHDYNKDNHLDGHELRHVLTDVEEGDNPLPPLSEIDKTVDHVLLEDDIDGDGKISWEEYLASQEYHRGTSE